MASYTISVPESALSILRTKLDTTIFPDELDEAGWQYGAPLADIKRLVNRWKEGYDWRKYEKQLNDELPQFTRDVEVEGHGTLSIHYVHRKSGIEGAIPLLFVHGWPGSFYEVRKILPLLTSPKSTDLPAFDVVALSLPGYGFSQAPKKKGFGLPQYAEVCNKLMLALGYNEYVTQGGDWGSIITHEIAKTYGKKHSKAWHTNMPFAGRLPPETLESETLTPAERRGIERLKEYMTVGNGYFVEQSTQPQTLGYSLADSPAGLLAWIYEKLVHWTDNYPWDEDEVLTWVSIYWFSRAGPAASVRIYYEFTKSPSDPTATVLQIPTGFSYFPREISGYPRAITRKLGNVVFEAEHDAGGHFAAHEQPELLVGDLQKMFGKGGPAFGVVNARDGYGA